MPLISGLLAKFIALFMSLITFIAGLFGGSFAPPVDGYVALNNTAVKITDGECLIIDSYDDFVEAVGEIKDETKKYDEEYFEAKSVLVFNATLPQTNYFVVCDSITEVGNTVTVRYHLESDGGFGATMISSQTVLVEVSKNVENASILHISIIPNK